jgi:DNA-binding transcriptional LysR family regulator
LIRFGSAGTLPNELAVRLARAFRRDHSAVEIRLSQSSYVTAPAAGIDRDAVDIALVRAPLVASGVEFKPLVRESRLLAMSVAHPLAGRTSVSLGELAGEAVVSSAHWPRQVRDHWAGVDDGADPAYEVSVLAGGPGEWLNAIADGRGVSICPASIASYYRRADLAYVAVVELAPSTVGLAWRRDHRGPLVRNFIASADAHVGDHHVSRWPG